MLGKSNNDLCLRPTAAEKEISKEEGDKELMPSSTMLKCIVRQKLRGHRRQTVPSDDDVQNVAGYEGSSLDSCSCTR